jgi:hypothetical protein
MKAAALVLLVALAFAPPKPDFSGTWKQDNARSNFANLPAPISVIDIITHKDPLLHLTQTVVGPQGDSVTSEHDYSTDGREQAGKSPKYTEKTSVTWDGNGLVFTNTRDYGGREVVIRERWELSPDGKTLTKERFSPVPRAAAKADVKQTFVLEKK